MAKKPHEIAHESHIHIGHHWYERPVFVGICFALIVAACFYIGEHTSSKPGVAVAATNEAEASKPIIIAAIGDSNTRGTGVAEKDQDTLSYPAQLQAKLGSHYQISNFGVSGSTLISGTNNPFPKHPFFDESKQLNPNIVLMMLGTNDARSQNWDAYEYKKQYIDFINQYKEIASNPKIYIVTPPAMFTSDNFAIDPILKNETIPEVYSIAEATSVEVIDVYSATKNHPDAMTDTVHPNAVGYGIIAQTIYEKLVTY